MTKSTEVDVIVKYGWINPSYYDDQVRKI